MARGRGHLGRDWREPDFRIERQLRQSRASPDTTNHSIPIRSTAHQLSDSDATRTSPYPLVPGMPPRPKLPHLTLFTSGPQCTLCTVAKAELAQLQETVPFHLDLYDIRRPAGVDPDYSDRTAWRRLYQYDVPVLHRGAVEWGFDRLSGREGPGGRIVKHRIDREKLAVLIKQWTEELRLEEGGEK